MTYVTDAQRKNGAFMKPAHQVADTRYFEVDHRLKLKNVATIPDASVARGPPGAGAFRRPTQCLPNGQRVAADPVDWWTAVNNETSQHRFVYGCLLVVSCRLWRQQTFANEMQGTSSFWNCETRDEKQQPSVTAPRAARWRPDIVRKQWRAEGDADGATAPGIHPGGIQGAFLRKFSLKM